MKKKYLKQSFQIVLMFLISLLFQNCTQGFKIESISQKVSEELDIIQALPESDSDTNNSNPVTVPDFNPSPPNENNEVSQIIPPTNSNLPPSNQASSPAHVFTEYTPMIGYSSNGSLSDYSTRNFKGIYSPQNLKNSGRENFQGLGGIRTYKLSVWIAGDKEFQNKKLLRFYLPAGTMHVSTGIFTYWGSSVQKVTTKFKDAPQIIASDLAEGQTDYIWLDPQGNRVSRTLGSNDWIRNLEFLTKGYEFAGLVGPQINLLLYPLSVGGSGADPGSGYNFKLTTGGWMYIRILELTGESIMTLVADITVDANIYDNWYNNQASWDNQLNPL